MYNGDRSRKETLVKYGFRLPSAMDNRPLKFFEFEQYMRQAIFVSATPGLYELKHSTQLVEQIIRPTGLIDPAVEVRPIEGQTLDVIEEVKKTISRGDRVLITTLTKKLAEELSEYLADRASARGTFTRRSRRWNAPRLSANCGWVSSTFWSGSISSGKASIFLRSGLSAFLTPTRKGSSAMPAASSRLSGERHET